MTTPPVPCFVWFSFATVVLTKKHNLPTTATRRAIKREAGKPSVDPVLSSPVLVAYSTNIDTSYKTRHDIKHVTVIPPRKMTTYIFATKKNCVCYKCKSRWPYCFLQLHISLISVIPRNKFKPILQ